MALLDKFFSKKQDQLESDDLSTELGRKKDVERKCETSSDNDSSVMPEWIQKQLNDANKRVRNAEKCVEEAKKKVQDLQNKLDTAKEDTERKIAKVRQELNVQIEYQKAKVETAEKERREVSEKLTSEFCRSLKTAQQRAQEECVKVDQQYRQNLNQKLNENMDLRRTIDVLTTKLKAVTEQSSVDSHIARQIQEERMIMEQKLETERHLIMEEAEAKIKEAVSAKSSLDKVFRSYPQAAPFAALALKYIGTIDSILSELDIEIAEHYMDSDDANYFYVRRRLKYLESIGDQNLVRYWDNDLDLLANHNIILVGSELDKVIDGDEMRIDEILRYYLYNAIIHKTAGPALILVREMLAMPIYAGIESVVNIDKIKELEETLVGLIGELGYEIVDVELFKPLGTSSDVVCVEQNDVELDGVLSGQVYEIVKLAVNYDTCREKTEVKIKQ